MRRFVVVVALRSSSSRHKELSQLKASRSAGQFVKCMLSRCCPLDDHTKIKCFRNRSPVYVVKHIINQSEPRFAPRHFWGVKATPTLWTLASWLLAKSLLHHHPRAWPGTCTHTHTLVRTRIVAQRVLRQPKTARHRSHPRWSSSRCCRCRMVLGHAHAIACMLGLRSLRFAALRFATAATTLRSRSRSLFVTGQSRDCCCCCVAHRTLLHLPAKCRAERNL